MGPKSERPPAKLFHRHSPWWPNLPQPAFPQTRPRPLPPGRAEWDYHQRISHISMRICLGKVVPELGFAASRSSLGLAISYPSNSRALAAGMRASEESRSTAGVPRKGLNSGTNVDLILPPSRTLSRRKPRHLTLWRTRGKAVLQRIESFRMIERSRFPFGSTITLRILGSTCSNVSM